MPKLINGNAIEFMRTFSNLQVLDVSDNPALSSLEPIKRILYLNTIQSFLHMVSALTMLLHFSKIPVMDRIQQYSLYPSL